MEHDIVLQLGAHRRKSFPKRSLDIPTPEELATRISFWFEHRAAGAQAARLMAEQHDARFMVQETQALLESA
jgi:hypothetical protein